MSDSKRIYTNSCYSLDLMDLDATKGDILKNHINSDVRVYVELDGKPTSTWPDKDNKSSSTSDKEAFLKQCVEVELLYGIGVRVIINPMLDINEAGLILQEMASLLLNDPPRELWEEAYKMVGIYDRVLD